MNEILQVLGHHFASGRFIVSVQADDKVNPRGVIVEFSDGTKQDHPIAVRDRDDFVRLWRQGFAFWNFKWASIE
ncbi:MAG: hypothetical protein WD851_24425 [Pirellulales bacterium]